MASLNCLPAWLRALAGEVLPAGPGSPSASQGRAVCTYPASWFWAEAWASDPAFPKPFSVRSHITHIPNLHPQRGMQLQIISSPLMENEMRRKREWRAGRQNMATATDLEPACYNVNMYHAGNMLQTNASKHANRSKSYHAYTKFAFHSILNANQMLYNHRTHLFESLPETRCSVNAILKGECSYRSSHPPTGSDEALKSPNKDVRGTKEQRLTWKTYRNLKGKASITGLRMHLRMCKPQIPQM